ncbi:DUF3179 domain-containing (seleno)protein [Aquirufa salirivi]|uniref:DUF3179 domain-containing (Seleno)protein n=1 Tax=Aquirufa salirivi TaxID=3104729 RepID=A0ABW8RUE2_9BACT
MTMKFLFFIGIVGIILFEILNVFFIMPMPGSQSINSIELAFFLYTNRWIFRFGFLILSVAGAYHTFVFNKMIFFFALAISITTFYVLNFVMAADAMFYQPKSLLLVEAKSNKIPLDRLIIGVNIEGESKAYPISLIGYHHQVRDKVGDKEIMVTYCTVCRTGRVFEPKVNGKLEVFRLVGMDHFNAMFEDKTTKSWWRQANGEALIGPLKGTLLPEIQAQQMSLAMWLKLYPNSKIMQPDPEFKENYDSTGKYETGKSKKELTGTDSLSWKRKSWVVGIEIAHKSIAIDWNRLKKERIIQLELANKPILLVLANDNRSFFAFERPNKQSSFVFKGNKLFENNQVYNLKGQALSSNLTLKPIAAHQEFWHSWETFHPNTAKY